jgi:hypothetical protein
VGFGSQKPSKFFGLGFLYWGGVKIELFYLPECFIIDFSSPPMVKRKEIIKT